MDGGVGTATVLQIAPAFQIVNLARCIYEHLNVISKVTSVINKKGREKYVLQKESELHADSKNREKGYYSPSRSRGLSAK